jgi:hypothetical protein
MISLNNWQHIQQLDYEQLPFKCKIFHEYGHFAQNSKKTYPNLACTGKEDQWKVVSHMFGNVGDRAPSTSIGPCNTGFKYPTKSIENPRKFGPVASQNNFETLSQLANSEADALLGQCSMRINSKDPPSIQEAPQP